MVVEWSEGVLTLASCLPATVRRPRSHSYPGLFGPRSADQRLSRASARSRFGNPDGRLGVTSYGNPDTRPIPHHFRPRTLATLKLKGVRVATLPGVYVPHFISSSGRGTFSLVRFFRQMGDPFTEYRHKDRANRPPHARIVPAGQHAC